MILPLRVLIDIANQAIGENSESGRSPNQLLDSAGSQSGFQGHLLTRSCEPLGAAEPCGRYRAIGDKGAITCSFKGCNQTTAIWVYSESGYLGFFPIGDSNTYRDLFPIRVSGRIPNRAVGIYCQSGYRGLFPIREPFHE